MNPRFSKRLMLDALENRIEQIITNNGFDRQNGTAQLDNTSQERILEYGKLEALRSLVDAIEGGYLGDIL